MQAAVLGATGYTGLVLLRILADHPLVRSILAVSSSRPGQPVMEADPGLPSELDGKLAGSKGAFVSLADAASAAERGGIDVVFSALPHRASAETCGAFAGKSVIIDLSADFRFRTPEEFSRVYGAAHPRPDLLDRAVYGLCEWWGDAIRTADIIGNPGCYPTATLLPLLPLARSGLLRGAAVVNAISGISGAGRKERVDLLYCERTENVCAYNPGTQHRHQPEIDKELKGADPALSLLFTPHLAPFKRGMAVTTVVELSREVQESGAGSVESIYKAAYGGKPFIRLTGARIPETRQVWGSNRCDIGWHQEGSRLILFSVIDNLVKGASGQAVQNMNIRFGLAETAGLRTGGEL